MTMHSDHYDISLFDNLSEHLTWLAVGVIGVGRFRHSCSLSCDEPIETGARAAPGLFIWWPPQLAATFISTKRAMSPIGSAVGALADLSAQRVRPSGRPDGKLRPQGRRRKA